LPLGGKTILVADDDALSAEQVTNRLKASGACVVTATTTLQALKHAHNRRPSLSIIDLELRGAETGGLRHCHYEWKIPFVVYTALHHRPRIGRWAAMPLVYKPDECGEVERAVLRLSEKPPPWPTF
jgi:DNA-binding response OmpR family regulator